MGGTRHLQNFKITITWTKERCATLLNCFTNVYIQDTWARIKQVQVSMI